MLKLILGLLKGAVVGGALGYGAYALDLGGAMHWLTYGLAGALVGLIAGRPIWALITDKEGTSWISVLKVGSSRVDLQACKLEYSIVSPK